MAGAAMTFAETAYEALRTIGKQFGETSLERVVEIQGNPSAWTVSLLDPDSPVKLQEIRVRNGRIAKTSTRSSAGRSPTPINLDELNLDSDGALEVVNRHLRQTVSPNRVDYTLSTDANRSTPIWVVTLREQARGGESFLQIAANNGAVLTSNAPGAPTADISEAGTAVARSEVITTATAEAEPPMAPQKTTAVEVTRREVPAETVAVEAAPEAATTTDTAVVVNEEPGPVMKEFRPGKNSRASKSRSTGSPDIVKKVAGKVERKVRFVRRIIPF